MVGANRDLVRLSLTRADLLLERDLHPLERGPRDQAAEATIKEAAVVSRLEGEDTGEDQGTLNKGVGGDMVAGGVTRVVGGMVAGEGVGTRGGGGDSAVEGGTRGVGEPDTAVGVVVMAAESECHVRRVFPRGILAAVCGGVNQVCGRLLCMTQCNSVP